MSYRVHELKTDEAMWDAIDRNEKTAEFRKDDRAYEVGDTLILGRGVDKNVGAGRMIQTQITHIVRGPAFGIPEGYALLSFAPIPYRAEAHEGR